MALLFGEIAVNLGYITQEQLDEVIIIQESGYARLGQVMVRLNLLTETQVEEVLTYQQSNLGNGKMFGDCAVELGLVNYIDLAEAIHYHTTSKGLMGEILIQLGYLTKDQRDDVIAKQLQDRSR